MLAVKGAVICLGYIVGLLLTGIPGKVGGIPVGAIGFLLTGVLAAFLVPRFWRTGPKLSIWLAASVVGFLAILYFQWKVPHPEPSDISHLVDRVEDVAPSPSFRVEGRIVTSPQLTQSQRIRFELEATQAQKLAPALSKDQSSENPVAANPVAANPVTGRIYVTIPLLQGTGLYPGQAITVTGSLYKPKPASNPGGFDFAKYLAQQGIFAGLNGKQIEVAENQTSPSRLWFIRQRIIRAQVSGLGVPEGPIVSAMVMGGQAVDVPHIIRDQFRAAGLSHALAASGAQVSLLISVVLVFTQRLSPKLRLFVGSSVLLLYLCLTGLEASVSRAGVMGFVALLALTGERKVKPIASILFTATFLLLCNPLWIWDLGFQLSFLATLGLLVTVPILTRWLDWMPTTITPLFTVPIAAYLWTLPLLMFTFGVVSPYSILVNILTSPLITVISIGGMIDALMALIHPATGSWLAGLLYYPTHLFIQIAAWGSQIPGSAWSVGTITIAQLILLYGLIALVWGWRKLQRYWWVAAMVGISLVMLPTWYVSTHLLRATILATSEQPILVLQERGRVTLLNSGSDADVKFTVLPFLQKQGINQIDWAIDPNLRFSTLEGWQRILTTLPIREFYGNTHQTVEIADRSPATLDQQRSLTQLQNSQGTLLPFPADRPLQLNSVTLQPLNPNPAILQIRFADQNWLLLNDQLSSAQQSTLAQTLPAAQVLWWTGEELSPDLLETIQPKLAIASARSISPQTYTWLQAHHVSSFVTDRDGAIQWTPKQGFRTTLSES